MADTSYPQAQYRRLEKNAVFPCMAYGAWTVEETARAPATPRGTSCAAKRTKSIVAGGTSGIRKALQQVRMIPFVLAANPDTN